MTKILHLYPEINITCGVSKSIFSIVTNTNEIYENYVFCIGGDGIDKYKRAGINIVFFPENKRGLFQTLKIFFTLFYFIRKQKIEIIHSHHRYFDLIAFIISKLISVRTITSVQSKVYGKKHLSYKSEILVACSSCIKEHLIKYFKIDPQKIKVIYNFVDLKDVRIQTEKSMLKRELGIDENRVVIGFIGRFSIREKGVDVLLEAFRRISREYANLKLIMIGDGDDKNYIDNFITNNNINTITLSPKENIYEYFNLIDIVVLPSRVEPFGIVAIEAGLMKKSLVASSVDGLKEIVDNGLNGILFQSENVEFLTNSLRTLIQENNLRIRLGEELYKKVMINYTSDIIIPLYKETYQRLMKNHR